MQKKLEVLALIPARGGSQGIKRKNTIDVNGRPLISYSIDHALSSSLVTRVVVSTDDEEIANIARQCGAEVPFMRPAELAGSEVLDWPVFEHALTFLKESEGYQPDLVLHLRPTAPFRKVEWVDDAILKLYENSKADSVRSVSAPNQHPYRMFKVDNEGYLRAIMLHEHPEPYLLRRQDLPEVYYYNCVIDVTRPETIFKKQSMTGDNILSYVMNPAEVLDIDTLEDLKNARLFFKENGL